MLEHVYLKSILYCYDAHYAVYCNAALEHGCSGKFDIKLGRLLGSFSIDPGQVVSGFAKLTKQFYLLAAYGRVIAIPRSDVIRIPAPSSFTPRLSVISTENYTPLVAPTSSIKIDYVGWEKGVADANKEVIDCGSPFRPENTVVFDKISSVDLEFKDVVTEKCEVKGTVTGRISSGTPNAKDREFVKTSSLFDLQERDIDTATGQYVVGIAKKARPYRSSWYDPASSAVIERNEVETLKRIDGGTVGRYLDVEAGGLTWERRYVGMSVCR